jgi:hypothetical protein
LALAGTDASLYVVQAAKAKCREALTSSKPLYPYADFRRTLSSAPVGHLLRHGRQMPFKVMGTIVHVALKAFSYVVLVLMAVGIVYASYISVKYWTGISV